MRGSAPLDIERFGTLLLRSGDLDPVYVALRGARLSGKLLKRWMLAYWLFYHVGVASYLSEREDFWGAAAERSLPRGAERRHFRGTIVARTLGSLRERGTPSEIVDWIAEGGRTFNEITTRARLLPSVGPWLAFKIADMLERVLDHPVDFSGCELSFYEEPRAAAELYAPGVALKDVVKRLERIFSSIKAPPARDRPVGVQEIETVLCKWKSHVGGHYAPGKDSREIAHALGWRPTVVSHLLRPHVPEIGLGA